VPRFQKMFRPLRRVAAVIIGLLSLGLGLAVSYDCYYLWFEETKNPYYSLSFWKSAAIVILLLLCILVPLIAAYKFIRYAVTDRL
jgi:ABC-type antimicrobial peptide transport system permease subunit